MIRQVLDIVHPGMCHYRFVEPRLEFVSAPPGHHGAAYDLQSYTLIQQVSDEWLDRWLKGSVSSTAEARR